MNGRPQGWYHLGHGRRIYSPLLMRFHCPDSLSPFGEGGLNAYAYCQGDPLNFTDPTGHSAEDLYAWSYMLSALTMAFGVLTLFGPRILRGPPPGSLRAQYAARDVSVKNQIGGLDAVATGIGMVGAVVGVVSTSLSRNDPQNAVASTLMHVTMGISGAVLAVKMTAYLYPKDPTSAVGLKVAKVLHGRKAVRDSLYPPPPAYLGREVPSRFRAAPEQMPTMQMREIRSAPTTALVPRPASPVPGTSAQASRQDLYRKRRITAL